MLSTAPHAVPDSDEAQEQATACRLAFEGLVRAASGMIASRLFVDELPTVPTLEELRAKHSGGATLLIGLESNLGLGAVDNFRRLVTTALGEPDRWLQGVRVAGVAIQETPGTSLVANIDNDAGAAAPAGLVIGVWGSLHGAGCAGLVSAQDNDTGLDASEHLRLKADIVRLETALAEERHETLNLRQRLAALEEPQWQRAETAKAIAREVWDEGRRRTLPYKIGKWLRTRGGKA